MNGLEWLIWLAQQIAAGIIAKGMEVAQCRPDAELAALLPSILDRAFKGEM